MSLDGILTEAKHFLLMDRNMLNAYLTWGAGVAQSV
jgi:hypothetical protein